MTMMTTHWAPKVFATLTPAHPHPLLVGMEVPAVLAILLPTHPALGVWLAQLGIWF